MNQNSRSRKRIVILGAGFAGLSALKVINKHLTSSDDVEIILIDQNNFFLFSPLLHQAALGVLHPWDIMTPLRLLKLGKHTIYRQARVEEIDFDNRVVKTSAGPLEYDYLLITLGSVINPCEVPGLDEHEDAFTLKVLDDSSDIKNHVYMCFERASIEQDPAVRKELLTFCILGAGYTGTELAAAFADVVYKCAPSIYRMIPQEDISIQLIEMKDRMIGNLPEEYSDFIARHMERHHIKLRFGSKVTGIGNGWVEINGDEKIPCRTLVRVTGVVANPVAACTDCEHDERGRLVVDDYLRVPNHPEVYVAGDCVHYHDVRTGDVAETRAHHAVRQAKAAGHNLAAEIRSTERKKYTYSDTMLIISMGRSNALFRAWNWWIRGFPALFVWVTAYSLLVTGVKNRFKIAVDWILSRLYGPDMAVTLPFRLSDKSKPRKK